MEIELDAIQKYLRDEMKVKFTTEWKKLNYKLIPTNHIEARRGNEEQFNKLLAMLKADKRYVPIKRTTSQGVSICCRQRHKLNQFDARKLSNMVEITVCTLEMSCRIQWATSNAVNEDGEETSMKAYDFFIHYWLPLCRKHGINMGKYCKSSAEGLEIKKTIHMPDIRLLDSQASFQFEIEHANHLDFHKFYISGLLETHPEFKPVIEELTEKSNACKEHQNIYKTGMAAMIGFFQSPVCGYRYAQLSADAINNAYSRFDKVLENLKKTCRPIATNTDGIWFVGDYHDEYEGPGLTQWSYDYKDCLIRFKTKGSYEFMCDGKYYAKVRGRTKLDRILPRDEWTWGSIFKNIATVELWKFEEDGISWIN